MFLLKFDFKLIMKRYFILVYSLILVAMLGFTIFVQFNPQKIVSSDSDDGNTSHFIHGVIKKIEPPKEIDADQIVKVRASSGDENGKLLDVTLTKTNNFNPYKVGDLVQIYRNFDKESSKYNYEIADFYHQSGLLWIVIIFVILAIIIAKKKGLKAVLSIAISLLFFYFLFIKMFLAGYSPLLSCILFVLSVTLFTIPMIHGFNSKSWSAILAIIFGYFFSLLISFLFTGMVQLGVAPDEDFRVMAVNYPQIDLSTLLIASLFIGAIGALIDTAISISSAIFEALKEHSGYSFQQVYKIGMEIGKDVLASMINTLLFAYLASSLPFLILMTLSKSSTFSEMINYDFIALELTRTLIGAISLVVIIPIAASISSYFFIFSKDKH